MKYCPQCHSSFDDSMQFCVNDRTLLISNDDYETHFSSSKFSQTGIYPPAPPPQTYNKFLIPIVFLLLGVSAVFAFLWLKQPGQTQTAALTTADNSAENYNQKLRQIEFDIQANQLEIQRKALEANANKIASQTAPASKPLPPLTRPGKADSYSGTVGSANTTFTVSWQNKLVSGSFYYNGNSNQVYTLSGTNYRDGEANVKVYNGGSLEGTMIIYKTIVGNRVCWGGSFNYSSGGSSPVNFCRYR